MILAILLSIVGGLVLCLVVSVAKAVFRQFKMARRRVEVTNACVQEVMSELQRRGVGDPDVRWSFRVAVKESAAAVVYLQLPTRRAPFVMSRILSRIGEGGSPVIFIAGTTAVATAYAQPYTRGDPWIEWRLDGGSRPARRRSEPAPGRVLACLRWWCGSETRELIDVIRADLARDRRELQAEGRGRLFIRAQQLVVEWREVIGICGRFLLRLVKAALALACLDRLL